MSRRVMTVALVVAEISATSSMYNDNGNGNGGDVRHRMVGGGGGENLVVDAEHRRE